MHRSRLKDIAERVCLSQTAVSKVLNNIPMRISKEKKQLVIETARKLNYKPNLIARSLQTQKTRTIGVVVPDISTLFYPHLVRSIEMKLTEQGYQVLICNSEDNASLERTLIENLTDRMVDGLVVAPAAGDENISLFRNIKDSGKPLIFVDRYIPGENFNYIVTDNKEGARRATEILLGKNIAAIVYLGERTRNRTLEDRLKGVGEQARNAGLTFSGRNIILTDVERANVQKQCRTILEKNRGKTGFFLESNRFLMGLLDAAKDKGYFIPENLAVVGFDSFEPVLNCAEDLESIRVVKLPVPFVLQDFAKMVEMVNNYLLTSLAGKVGTRVQVKIPAKIIA